MSEPSEDDSGQRAAVPGLRHNRDYRLLWTGGAVSLLGSQMSAVAYPLLVLAQTGSATKAGLVGTSTLLAQTVFRLPAGALVDRWDRRKTMLAADALRGAVLAGVALALVFGVLSFVQLVAAAFVENALGELFRPAATAAVRRVIDPAQMANAISKTEARSYGATIVGSPVGGFLFSLARSLPFAADALSYGYSFLSTLLVRAPMQPQLPEDANRIGLVGQLTGGVRWIWTQPLIRAMVLSAAGFNLVFASLYLTVIVAAKAHGASSTQVGTMLAIASAGGFVGALLANHLASTRHPAWVVFTILWSATALVPVMALDQNPYVLGVLLSMVMVLTPTANTILISHQIALTPDYLQGRVDAAGYFVSGIASPLAPVGAGLLLSTIDASSTLLVLGAAMAVTTVLATMSHALRNMPHLSELVAT